MAVDFAAPGMDGSPAAAAAGLSGLCFLAGLGLDLKIGQDLTPDERAGLERLRTETLPAARAEAGPASSTPVDEFTLLRFLRADKLNPVLAAARLVKTLQWRADNRVDHILAEAPAALPVYHRMRVRLFPGCDRNGNVVMIERLGEFFGSNCGGQLTIEEWLRCYTHDMATIQARFRQASEQHGRPVHRVTFIGDLAGLKVGPVMTNIKILKACVHAIEVHFPEQAGQIFLYNAPLLVETMWGLTKRILDPSVASKVAIHRGVPSAELLKVIPADVLPQELGGANPLVFPHAITCHKQLAMVRESSRPSLPTVGSVGAQRAPHKDPFCLDADRPASVCSWPWASCLEREQDAEPSPARRRPSPIAVDVESPRKDSKEHAAPTCADQGTGKRWQGRQKSPRCVAAGGECRHVAIFAFVSLAALHIAMAVAVGLPEGVAA